MNFKLELKKYQELVNEELTKYLKKEAVPESILNHSVEYSLMAGGKRLRPILMLKTYQLFDKNIENCMPFAVGGIPGEFEINVGTSSGYATRIHITIEASGVIRGQILGAGGVSAYFTVIVIQY